MKSQFKMSKRPATQVIEELGSPVVIKRNKLAPGKELHIEAPMYEEEPRAISMAEAKRLLKAYRKPREYTEEGRAKMLENLAKGREKRQAMLQNPAPKEQVVTRKYKIKPRATPVKQSAPPAQKQPVQEEDPSTEDELYEKIAKKERMLRKLQELQQLAQPKTRPQAALRPARYSMFY
jgi:hypothetical protein